MEAPVTKQAIAVRAVIVKDGKALIIREASAYKGGANHGKYDFPGGKIAVGEPFRESFHREVGEEIGATVAMGQAFHADEWRPVVNGAAIQIVGIFFRAELVGEEIELGPDHDHYAWVGPEDYADLPLIDATKNALDALYRQ
jgi:8-oxo-dGTP pyrophosphatase MutT (NUDIX family)